MTDIPHSGYFLGLNCPALEVLLCFGYDILAFAFSAPLREIFSRRFSAMRTEPATFAEIAKMTEELPSAAAAILN